MNRSRKLVFAIVGVAVLIISLFAVWSLYVTSECSKRQRIPSVPIYPGSVLVEMSGDDDPLAEEYSIPAATFGITRPMLVSAEYSSDASAQNIIDFYEAQTANCRGNFEGSSRVACEGTAEPFGTYSAYIDKVSDLSTPQVFTLEIRWSVCGLPEDL